MIHEELVHYPTHLALTHEAVENAGLVHPVHVDELNLERFRSSLDEPGLTISEHIRAFRGFRGLKEAC